MTRRASWKKIAQLLIQLTLGVGLLSFAAGATQRWHLVYDKTGDILGVSDGNVLYPAIPHSGGIPSGAPPIQLKPQPPQAPASTSEDGPTQITETPVKKDDPEVIPPNPAPQTVAPVSQVIPLPRPRPKEFTSKFASTDDIEDAKSQGVSGCPYADGRCYKKDQSRIPMGKIAGMEKKKKEPAPSHGSCRLLAAAKKTVAGWPYYNRKRGGGDCGAGVGRSILKAGFKFPTSGRYAINYMHMLPDHNWTSLHMSTLARAGHRRMTWSQINRINQEEIRKAPPGSVLVFAGPCTRGYPHPEGTFGCGGAAGNRVGDVTIKGDNGWFYFDGKTNHAPAAAHRYLVGVFVPPGTNNERCGK